ncbi:MAG: hypothetical protein J6Y81_04570 [Ruminococcus sp.]|nr:hypothetical protein [Ruminococcus sp.]
MRATTAIVAVVTLIFDEVNPLPRIAEGTSSLIAFLLSCILYQIICDLSRYIAERW